MPLFLALVTISSCIWTVTSVHVAPTRLRPVTARLRARFVESASSEQAGLGQAKKVAPNPLITARPGDSNQTDSTNIVAGMPAGVFGA